MPRIYILTLFPDNLNEKESARYVLERVWAYNRDYGPFELLRLPCTNCCDEECYGVHIADERVGRLQKYWRAYKDLPANNKPSWQAYINQWQQVAFESSRQGPYYQEPDPFCTVCSGTGIMESTYGYNGKIDYFNPVQLSFDTSDIWHIQEIRDNISKTKSRCIITPDGNWHEFDYRIAWHTKAQEVLQNLDDFNSVIHDSDWQEKVKAILRKFDHLESSRIKNQVYTLAWQEHVDKILKPYVLFKVIRIVAHV